LIRDKLTAAFSAGRIICPMPTETLVESSPCETQVRIAIENLFRNVSNGERFLVIWDLIIDETLRLARPSHVIYPFGAIGAGRGRRDEAAKIAREANAVGREKMRQQIVAYTFAPGAADRTPEEIFRSGIKDRCGIFWCDLKKFGADPTTPVSDYEWGWLMDGLMRHNLTTAEASKIGEAVRLCKWERIAVNHFDLLIGSRWDHDHLHGQRPHYHANDEIDRWRSAVALCYSDLYITDGYTADLCRRARVADHTSTLVYSTRQTHEILQFIEECSRIDH
jgi:hypothetical protein